MHFTRYYYLMIEGGGYRHMFLTSFHNNTHIDCMKRLHFFHFLNMSTKIKEHILWKSSKKHHQNRACMSLIVGCCQNLVTTKRDVLVGFGWEMIHGKMTKKNLLTRWKNIFLLIFNDENWHYMWNFMVFLAGDLIFE